VFIYVNAWTVELTRPVAECLVRLYELASVSHAPPIEGHIRQWTGRNRLKSPTSRLYSMFPV
jgi:hypothetical protein